MKKRPDYIPPECEKVSVMADMNFLASDVSLDSGGAIEDMMFDGIEFIW